ncbi:WD repeat-containing protein 76 isoform X2 [Spea bombifrons]|uniref:WD repeat-containing protein 76 isoform X2 n=1 Tax=Spea bombifrons TaxID=233779 RepID=UPI00234A990B|nr:WD repeat-containing protein 76 isoform X2 [Spea bombifrons]
MGTGKKTAQEVQETTPISSRVSAGKTRRASLQNRALSPPKRQHGKRKHERDLDDQEKGTPRKKAYIAGETSLVRKHPIVMLSQVTPETLAHVTTEHAEDTDDEAPGNQSDLSPYELERLNNIKENAKFLQSLKLLECAKGLTSVKSQNKTSGTKRVKPLKVEEVTARRRSTRLQRITPDVVPVPTDPEPVEENKIKPPGPLDMIAIYDRDDQSTLNSFLKTWESISKEEMHCSTKPSSVDLKRYVANLKRMTLQKETVAKVVHSRIFSVAVHPSESHTLVAAGDKLGQVGLWDVDCASPNETVHTFNPHAWPVSSMYFSPVNPAHLLSLSYDGSVRCGDVCRSVFDEVFRDEDYRFSSFDFLSADASVLIVGYWDAYLSIVDRRTPGTSYEQQVSLGIKSVRTVSMHPLNRDLCVVAGASDVCIYDVRKLQQKKQPVLSLTGHTRSVASAYFSPGTGNRILTTCADDQIRVYDSSNLSTKAPLITSIRHNNNTGRWLSRFRAIWDPKLESCFVTGSMARPREIEVYHESGNLLHSFRDSEHLGSVCSINAVHPTRNVLVGGNSSGRLHVFLD